MSLFSRFGRQKEDPELARRAALLRHGRIGDATVVETNADAEGIVTLSYNYTIINRFSLWTPSNSAANTTTFPAPEFNCAMTRNVPPIQWWFEFVL
jgi:hypothetical protein